MSKLHVKHVREALEKEFRGLIDLSDYAKASESLREKSFLTRALAAMALQRFSELEPATAAAGVVDGSGDNGIDAVYIDHNSNRVILVQSKWDGSGNGTIGLGDTRNFIAGLKDLTDEKFERFTPRLQAMKEAIRDSLSDPAINFLLVVATTGQTDLAKPVREAFDDMLADMNNPQPMVELEILGLQEFHSLVVRGLSGARVDLDVTLENWGTVSEPYEAFYGVVSASIVADWYEDYGDKLFSQNIRNALGNTSVNSSLVETLCAEANHFWYFNNGLTVLCETIRKKPRGASTRTFGEFMVTGASVVNGAQTVASIHNALRRNREEISNALVWVRFISLEACPDDFAAAVTRATNTQNAVETRDFVSLDAEQHRLRTELLLTLQKTYSIKRGDLPPPYASGCTVSDATIALACANRDPSLSVLAKSNIGRLWESTDRSPYRTLFNSSVTPYRLWRCVETSRAVEKELDEQKKKREGRARSIAVQGNRIVLHLVFRLLALERVDDADFDWETQLAKVSSLTVKVLDYVTDRVEMDYANNYITSLFKNVSRCRDIVTQVRAALS